MAKNWYKRKQRNHHSSKNNSTNKGKQLVNCNFRLFVTPNSKMIMCDINISCDNIFIRFVSGVPFQFESVQI